MYNREIFAQGTEFLSTPSARRATRLFPVVQHQNQISIHALREEGDCARGEPKIQNGNFYPRPPRGGRPDLLMISKTSGIFLSTPSARRATCRVVGIRQGAEFLSTPSARRATALCPAAS